MKNITTISRKLLSSLWVTCSCFLLHNVALANTLIPMSSDDAPEEGTSVATTWVTIFQKEILPLIEIFVTAIMLFYALKGLWKGYAEYQREKDMGALKEAAIASVILIVFGGTVIYLLDLLRSYQFA